MREFNIFIIHTYNHVIITTTPSCSRTIYCCK
nr:MAG TPA: hypothetical protein [Caudoviricetes sp.]